MKKYLYYLTVNLTLILLLTLPIAVFVKSTGENMSIMDIVAKQNSPSSVSIYGTALRDNTSKYKLHMLKQRDSKIVALGSSRVLQFQEYMFNDSFYNLGGVMNSISDGNMIADYIIKLKPEIILLGIDIWWFNENYLKPNQQVLQLAYNSKIENILSNQEYNSIAAKISDVRQVYKYIYSGKLKIKDMYSQLTNGSRNIGISGIYGDGFSPDGSYNYTRLISGATPPEDPRFQNTKARIKAGGSRFQHGTTANQQFIKKFTSLINKFEGAGIKVIAFFPPFAPDIQKSLNKENGYGYINDLKVKLSKNKIYYLDYGNSHELNSSSCEFIDGFHGGNITYARILLDIVRKNSVYEKYINTDYLMEVITKYSNLSSIPNPKISTFDEIDHLELGCNKLNKYKI